jgi:hypothetical protein
MTEADRLWAADLRLLRERRLRLKAELDQLEAQLNAREGKDAAMAVAACGPPIPGSCSANIEDRALVREARLT